VRPLRQITGEAEFNEVFLTDVRIPDASARRRRRGLAVAQTTLMNERVAIGGGAVPARGRHDRRSPDSGASGPRCARPAARRGAAALGRAEAAGWPASGCASSSRPASPARGLGPEARFARLNQEISRLELELRRGGAALRGLDHAPAAEVDFVGRSPGYRYLRAKGNSIEGGTSEILRNIIAERVLGLPRETASTRTSPGRTCPNDVTCSTARSRRAAGSVRACWRSAARSSGCSPGRVRRAVRPEPVAHARRRDGLAGMAVPERFGGGGASLRESAVVLEELGRCVAPVPFLSSAVVATTALLTAGAADPLTKLAAGETIAVLAVPFVTGPGSPLPCGHRRR
jgi:hypothetical protein